MKKVLALLMMAMMTISMLLPTNALAEEEVTSNERVYCANGQHVPDLDDPHEPFFTECNGGFKEKFYICTICSMACDANGEEAIGYQGSGQHTLSGDITEPCKPCQSGFSIPTDYCVVCREILRVDGTRINNWQEYFVEATEKHTPGDFACEADYTECGGGSKVDIYWCSVCDTECDAEGNDIEWLDGNGQHTPSGTVNESAYNACTGGYIVPVDKCTVCNMVIHPDGTDVDFSTEYKQATELHTPGNVVVRPADFKPCSGGCKDDGYQCTVCNHYTNKDGKELWWYPATTKHTPGEHMTHAADPCYWGYLDWYKCSVCYGACGPDGGELTEEDIFAGTGKHDVASVTTWYPANNHGAYDQHAGFEEEWAFCPVCGDVTNKEGVYPEGYEVQHVLVEHEAVEATADKPGSMAYWYDEICGLAFYDEFGCRVVENMDDLVVGFTRVVIEEIAEVPAAISDKYASVAQVESTMEEKAIATLEAILKEQGEESAAENGAEEQKPVSVMMDIVLQVQNDEGKWEAVTPENFPKEGVTVTIAYPEGTNKDDFNFVITHMITSGDNAGNVEVMAYTLTDAGIVVTFKSLSPVMVTYQKKAPKTEIEVKPTEEEKPAEQTPSVPANTNTTNPPTGDQNQLAAWIVMLISSGLGILVMMTLRKKKEN